VSAAGEIAGGVVDDVAGSQALGLVGVAGADHGGGPQTHGAGQLEGEGADATGGTVDEHIGAGLRVSGAEAEQGGGISTCGSPSSAWAIPSRCRMPSE